MRADLDTLLTSIYVLLDDFLPERAGPGRNPQITDAELIALAIAQVFLGVANDRQFLGFAIWRLGQLFPCLPQQPGYNKRLRALAPQITRANNYLAYVSPSIFDGLRLLDSTPVPCGASRETVKRSECAGNRRLRLLPKPFALLLGLPPLSPLRRRRHPDRLRTRSRQRARA